MSVRAVPDACPGVLAPHDAADGALARIRLPGGVVSAAALRVIADAADDLGDGHVHLTSRGNLQLRGLDRADPSLAVRLTAAGLLPSRTHERARNVLATPLSGLAALAQDLDRELCARPILAELPGRFLFAFDDGRSDVAVEEPDLCWQAGRVLVAGVDAGVAVHADGAVAALLAAAEAFLQVRGAEWRVRELPDTARAAVARAVGAAGGATSTPHAGTPANATPPSAAFPRDPRCSSADADLDADASAGSGPLGESARAAARHDAEPVPGAGTPPHIVVAPVLGELISAQVRAIAAVADTAVVTPWRTILLVEPTGTPEGVPTDPVLARVSSCTGRPGCAKALADVRADTRAALAAGTLPEGRVHVSGCARRCGSPRGAHIAFVAGEGYL